MELNRCSKVSGYIINEKKSIIMELNIEHMIQSRLRSLYKAEWAQRGVRYLGIKISVDPQDLLVANIVAYKNKMGTLLKSWQKLSLSWWRRMAAIKMKILPVLLLQFQNLMIPVPMRYTEEIQGLLNKFLWQDKKSSINVSLLQQRPLEGGIAYPSITKYYQAS